jgi:GMP reductase
MYSLNEIALIPSTTSPVSSRSEVCCTYSYEDKLPIFVAPMTSLIDEHNFHIYEKSNFQVIMPVWNNNYNERIENLKKGNWTALTLDEFIHCFCSMPNDNKVIYHVLIDCANGHMEKLLQAVKDAKQEYGSQLEIMAGNVAHPATYWEYCKAGIDFCRLGIGGNVVCETGSLTGFHTSLPWLLEKIKRVKLLTHNSSCKIIADGGVNSISKIIKCLALGADYVMCGYLFSQVDSVARNSKKVPVTDTFSEIRNLYYGQASVQGQLDRFGPKNVKRVEGSQTYVPIKYQSLQGLESDIKQALESAMSYAGKFALEDFVGNVAYEVQSIEEYKSFNA